MCFRDSLTPQTEPSKYLLFFLSLLQNLKSCYLHDMESQGHCALLCLVPQSCPTLCNPMDCSLLGSSAHGDSPGKNTGVGFYGLFQVIFPIQGSNPGLSHCRRFFTIWVTKATGPKEIETESILWNSYNSADSSLSYELRFS